MRVILAPGRRGRWGLLLILFIMAGWTTGCMPKVHRPEVNLAGVRLGGLGLQGGTIYVRLGVINPNRFALHANGLTYKLDLQDEDGVDEWSELVRGRCDESVRVEPEDSTIIEIPVEFRYSGIGTALRRLLDTGAVTYRISGDIAVEQPLRTTLPYRHTGRADLLEFE